MKTRENLVCKVVPDRIFSLAIHPAESKILVCAGGKWGKLGMWDVVRDLCILLQYLLFFQP